MKILVIGGCGFVGSSLVKFLIHNNHKVTVFDKKNKLINNFQHRNIKFIKGDIYSISHLDKSIKNNDVVYHLAGLSDLNDTLNKPIETVKYNILGTVNILELCVKYKIKRFIFASTIYVHSKEGGFYKSSKLSAESYIKEYNKLYNLKFTILRYGSIYGPGASINNGVNSLINKAINDKVVKYEGNSETIREYVHVDDVAKTSIEILKKSYENKFINISGNNPIKIKDFIQMVLETLNMKKKIVFTKKSQLGHYIITPYSFNDDVGIKINSQTSIDFREGILQVIKYVKNNK